MTSMFYITSMVAIASAVCAITRREAMHGILYLVVMLLSLALLFFILGAPFVAALEVIVYAGAIVVLFLFVIMMLNPKGIAEKGGLFSWLGPLVLVLILGAQWFFMLGRDEARMTANLIGPKRVGELLLSEYLFGIELVAVFLMVGLVGAYYLGGEARGERQETRSATGGPRVPWPPAGRHPPPSPPPLEGGGRGRGAAKADRSPEGARSDRTRCADR